MSMIDKLKQHPIIATVVFLAGAITGAIQLVNMIKTELSTPPEAPPDINSQYFTISGDAISLMLQGKIDDHLRQAIGGKFIVWQNPVYQEVQRLQQHARPLGDRTLQSESLSEQERSNIPGSTPLLPGLIEQEVRLEDGKTFAITGHPAKSEVWRYVFVSERTPMEIQQGLQQARLPAYTLRFVRDVSCADAQALLAAHNAPEAPMYREFTKAGCASMSFPVTATYLDTSCGPAGWDIHLSLPKVSMKVLVVGNISGKPVKINEIIGAVSTPAGASTPVNAHVGDGTLENDMRLIIPLSLAIEAPPRNQSAYEHIPFEKLPAAMADGAMPVTFYESRAATTASGESPGSAGASGEEASAPPEPALETAPVFELTPARIYHAYADLQQAPQAAAVPVGPRMDITQLTINGRPQAVHTASQGGTYISNGLEVGSCPQLYVRSGTQAPVHVGKILVGRDSAAYLGSNRRHLPSWPDELTIEETDPETTYLHGVRVVCEKADGSRIAMPGSHGGDYPLKIERYQRAHFTFPKLSPNVPCATIFAEITGYYIPTRQARPAAPP